MGDFAHLHVHTEYSMLDGASRVDELMRTVAEMGMPACAITDHGVMFGAIDFYRAGQKYGVNPILGSELYVAPGNRRTKGRRADGDEPYTHLTVLAQDNTGYGNLMRLTSRAYLEGYWYKPRIDRELLAEHADGLIVLSGCLGAEINQLLLKGEFDQARAAAAWHRDLLGDRFYIELQDHDIPQQHATNPDLVRIARDLGIGMVVTNDSHYTHQADYEAHDALLCVQTGSQRSDPDRFKFHNDQFWVKSAELMQAAFPDLPETWKNTLAIAERCQVDLDFDTMHLPRFDCPPGEDDKSWLRKKVAAGAARRYGDPLPEEARARLDFELGVIEQMGFSAYFLIVADLVEYAKANGIRVGPGRGSAAGCAVSYCTGITDLDPLAHGLLFERFLNPERISMPDIDMDFDERRRGEMIRYAAETYGQDHVAQIVTFQTIKAKQAIKDSARVLGMPYAFGDRICKMFPPAVQGKEASLEEAREKSGELRQAWDSDPDARKVLELAGGLEGLRRQHSIHAAGVVIADEPITDICPVLQVEGEGEVVTQYDGGTVEDLGLLKMDFLGLRNLTVISDALVHIKATTGEDIVIEDLPLDDAETYAMISRGETDGVFQLESPGYKALCRQLKPDRFEDITALGALYRPGPMSADLHNAYARRKHGTEPISYIHDDVEEILAESYGLLIYQEQVQRIAQKIAGFTLGEADLIRKAMGKKLRDKMDALKDKFIQGTVDTGYPRKLGVDLWNQIEGFASYAFNKSHSAAYGLVTYQTAWLKAHHPVEYMAALLESVKNHKDKLPAGLHTCRTMGITVLVPDINESQLAFAPVVAAGRSGPRSIRFGLSAVRNVGEQVVHGIVEARTRQGAFTDFHDFTKKVDAAVLNRRTIESLIKAGAFEGLGHPRKGLTLAYEAILDSELAQKRKQSQGEFSFFDIDDYGQAGLDDGSGDIPDVEFDRKEKLAFEREMLGLYVSDHPLFGIERVLADLTSAPIPALLERTGTTGDVTVAGLLTGVTKKFTRKGDPYVVGVVEDLQGGIEAFFFPSCYQAFAELLVDDAVLVVQGRLDDGDPPRIIADRVSQPDLTEVTGAPLQVRLHPAQCAPDLIGRLHEVLREHTGPVPVHLVVRSPDGRVTELKAPETLGVKRNAGLYAELKSLLGTEAVA